jgi:hypothetical protein
MAAVDLPAFVEALPRALVDLRAAVEAVRQPALLPLDLSYESLDRLEDYYRICLEGNATPDEQKQLRGSLSRYLGATLIEHTGGVWKIVRGSVEPLVGKLPQVTGKGSELDPAGPVLDFKRTRSPGWLRDATERWDLALRRRQLATLMAHTDDELAKLRDDVEELTGIQPSVLDGNPGALAAVEAALKRLITANAPRERRREVRSRAVLFLGTVVMKAVGHGEWMLCDDADNSNFGEFTVNDWAPSNTIRVNDKTKPDHLLSNVTFQIGRMSKP